MPGRRLTQADRQQIAAGLADGLSLAQIARRLSRPTSTVSREVNRNLRADGYRADQAQRATQRRARRHTSSAAPGMPAGGPRPAGGRTPDSAAGEDAEIGRDPEAVHEYEESLASVLVGMGLPRMISRVLCCLYITDSGSLTSAELVQRLRVSPASVSKAVGYLEAQQLVRRESAGGRRRERYVVDDDAWYKAWVVSGQTNMMLAAEANRGAEILGSGTPAGARLALVGRFLELVSADLMQRGEYYREMFFPDARTTEL
jgi:hypothetical protein